MTANSIPLPTTANLTSPASLPTLPLSAVAPPGDAVGRAMQWYHQEALSRLEHWISSEEKLVRSFLHGGAAVPPAGAAGEVPVANTAATAATAAALVVGPTGGGATSFPHMSSSPLKVLSSWTKARAGSHILALSAPAPAHSNLAAGPTSTTTTTNSATGNNAFTTGSDPAEPGSQKPATCASSGTLSEGAAGIDAVKDQHQSERAADLKLNGSSGNTNSNHHHDDECDDEDEDEDEEVWDWAEEKASPRSGSSNGSVNRDTGVGGAIGRLTDAARNAVGARMRGWRNAASSSDVTRQETSVDSFILRVPEDTDARVMTQTVLQPKGKSRESLVSIFPIVNDKPTIAQRILKSTAFQSGVSCLILANTMLMGVQVELAARDASSESLRYAQIADGFFAVLFTAELLVRAKALGWQSCSPSHRGWMFFDSLLVTSSMVDLSVSAATDFDNTANLNSARILRILRITRMIRVLRFIRVVRFIRALRVMIYSIMVTLKSVIWAVLLLFIVIYCFALLFTNAITDHLSGNSFTSSNIIYCQVQEEGNKYWRNMGVSMMTLLEAVTGGVDWKDPLCPLSDVHWLWLLVFMAFILFTYFAILNVVTAAFCQGAIEGQLYDREQTVKDLINHKKSHLHKTTDIFQNMFDQLDQDSSGDISMEEFKAHLADDSVQALLSLLELTDSDLWLLFQMLDSDGSNRLDAHEFISGCMRLKGTARSIDLAKFSFESHRMSQYLAQSLQCLRSEMNQSRLLLDSLYAGSANSGGLPPPPTLTTPTHANNYNSRNSNVNSSSKNSRPSTPTATARRERERGDTGSSSASLFRSIELAAGGGGSSPAGGGRRSKSPVVSQDTVRPATDRLDC